MSAKKLSKEAYGGVKGKDYIPYNTDETKRGSNAVVVIIGLILTIVFAASTAYSGMKAGLTVAAGIPGSIIGSAFIAAFAKKKGLLGKNLVQGMASGGESVASGLIFVLPAILLVGSQISFIEGIVIGVGGVLFGLGVASLVLDYLIVEEHGNLMYPESMAISETLVASEGAGDSVKFMGVGFVISGIITVLTGSFLNICNSVYSKLGETGYKFKFEIEANPLLLGIGFIVGLEVSLAMFAGSILSNFGILPLIGYFSDMAGQGHVVWNNASTAIGQMDVNTISGAYVKYIGAGMMLCGGVIGAIKLIPVIVTSIKQTMGAKTAGGNQEGSTVQKLILFGGIIIGLVGAVMVSGSIIMAIVGIVISFILSALFVIVAGRLTGTIGTSNLPVSGMTIASLVIATLIFVIAGWTDPAGNKTLLMFASFIVVAIAMAGGYTQSQKVTFVIGGNKPEMQKHYAIAGIVGVVVVIGVMILLADQLSITGANPPFALPQANLMATLTSGIMSGELPWVMIIVGIVMALFMFFLDLPIMTVAIGFYLPISTSSIILIGALIRVLVEKMAKSETEKIARVSRGISLSSGLVAGGSIIGLIGIILQVAGVIGGDGPKGFAAGNGMAIVLLIAMVIATVIAIMATKLKTDD